MDYANFFHNREELTRLNWDIIKSEEWGRQYGTELKEQKMAEFLIWHHLPIRAIVGIDVINDVMLNIVTKMVQQSGIRLLVKVEK